MFQLTKSEYDNLKSQFGTSSFNNYDGVRKMPYVFTEQGVAMLATILKSKVAVQTSIKIMDTFVNMRKYISNNLYQNEKKLINHENRILKLEESFDKLNEKKNMLKKKYQSQYCNVSFINNNTFNDRFLIIDRKILYNSGSSFKDLGKKYFYIGKIDDEEILNNILIKIGG